MLLRASPRAVEMRRPETSGVWATWPRGDASGRTAAAEEVGSVVRVLLSFPDSPGFERSEEGAGLRMEAETGFRGSRRMLPRSPVESCRRGSRRTSGNGFASGAGSPLNSALVPGCPSFSSDEASDSFLGISGGPLPEETALGEPTTGREDERWKGTPELIG